MPQKLNFEDWKSTMSFHIDDDFDNRLLQSIDPLTTFINQSANQFTTIPNLSNFLDKASVGFSAELKLKAFISLIGLSEERLKRVVSLLRWKFRDEIPSSEWDIRAISRKIIIDEDFKRLLVSFFLNGRDSALGIYIPLYYMKNFRLQNEQFITDLTQFSYVHRILNDNEIQGKYSNQVGAAVENVLVDQINLYKLNSGKDFNFITQKEYPMWAKNVDIIIPSLENPKLLIECSYNITTGSGQSKRADQLVELYGILMRHNANNRHNQIKMINYCDGFGWLGRQNDLFRIYEASHYVLNKNNIGLLDGILEEAYPN